MNGYQGQLVFRNMASSLQDNNQNSNTQNISLIPQILADIYGNDFYSLIRLGINVTYLRNLQQNFSFTINSNPIVLGTTEMYEAQDLDIKSNQSIILNIPAQTLVIIDYVITLPE